MRFLTGLVLGVLCLAACTSSSAQEIRVTGNRIFLPVIINEHAAEALMDSGAEMTLVDRDYAEQIGLSISGGEQAKGTGASLVDVQFAEGVRLEAAGNTLERQTVVVLDLEDIASRVVGEPLSIIAGRELFDAGRYYLDIEGGRFHKVGEGFLPAGLEVKLTDANGIKQMPVSFNGGAPVSADFDLGNGNEILLSEEFALRTGLLTEDHILGTKSGGGLGGSVERKLVRIDTLSIAGLEFHDVVAAVAPTADGSEANIGMSVLRNFVMVIDFPENRLWLAPRVK